MAIAVVLTLLIVGSVVFHFWSPWWLTPVASNWSFIDDTLLITFWVTGIVFVLVNFFVVYCVVRFRHKKGQRAAYEPENKKLEIWLTVITTIGVAAMLAPGLFVWADFVNVPDDASEVEAIGQQWHWSYRFPGEDKVFGEIDAKIISVANPFGIDPNDPMGQDDVLISSPEVHLPIDQPVKILLRSKDVLHDFAVAQFRVKMDLVPGMVTYLWLTPTKEGEFEVLCEEYCGLAHYAMRGRVVVETEEAFQAWLSTYPTFAQTAALPPGDAAAGQASYAVCMACHGAQGEGIEALHAPKLSGQEDWYLIQQLQQYKKGIRGSHADDIYGAQMIPMAATLADDTAIRNIVAYIGTLPDTPAPAVVTGDVVKGKDIYSTCKACHGSDGQGIWSMKAPRQAGMSDWYLAAQLQNFRNGIRGKHPQDMYGSQMVFMSSFLADDQAINDVVAYINTL
jgi:cytochrome c oxidase subunit 2